MKKIFYVVAICAAMCVASCGSASQPAACASDCDSVAVVDTDSVSVDTLVVADSCCAE